MNNLTNLFYKTYQLTFVDENNKPTVVLLHNRQRQGLRIAFNIQTDLYNRLNISDITVYNLTDKQISHIEGNKKGKMSLSVGYNNNLFTIFTGDIINIDSFPKAPDKITTFFSNQNRFAMTTSNKTYSFKAGTSLGSILVTLSTDFLTNIKADKVPPIKLKGALALEGTLDNILNKLTTYFNLDYFNASDSNLIDINTVYILPKDSSLNDSFSAKTLSYENGLLDVPVRNYDFLNFKSKIIPSIIIGNLIKIDVKDTLFAEANKNFERNMNTSSNGIWKIEQANYTGDTHGETWDVSIRTQIHKEL